MTEQPYSYTGETVRHPRAEEPRPAEIPGCTLVQDLIPLYLDNEVSPESHVLIANHIQECPRCSGYLAGARSVRSQILHEQQAVRAAAGAQPTVAQVREPIASSLGLRLWQTLMVLTYSVGLLGGLIGFGDGGEDALMVGTLLSLFGLAALGGLMVVGTLRSRLWRVLMLLTGIAGVLLTPLAILTQLPGLAIYSFGMLILAAWGRWLGQSQSSSGATRPLKSGPNRALLTAIVSVLLALACAGVALFGLTMATLGHEPGMHIVGSGMLLVGGAGLLLINQRRGWLPGLTTRLTVQQVLGYLLIGGGMLVLTFLAQGLMNNLLPVLLVTGIGGGLALLGYRLIRSGTSSS